MFQCPTFMSPLVLSQSKTVIVLLLGMTKVNFLFLAALLQLPPCYWQHLTFRWCKFQRKLTQFSKLCVFCLFSLHHRHWRWTTAHFVNNDTDTSATSTRWWPLNVWMVCPPFRFQNILSALTSGFFQCVAWKQVIKNALMCKSASMLFFAKLTCQHSGSGWQLLYLFQVVFGCTQHNSHLLNKELKLAFPPWLDQTCVLADGAGLRRFEACKRM